MMEINAKVNLDTLIGETARSKILLEFASDPFNVWSVGELTSYMNGVDNKYTEDQVKQELDYLVSIGMLIFIDRVNAYMISSYADKIWAAITLLIFAINDEYLGGTNSFVRGLNECLSGRTSIFMPFNVL